MRKPAESRATSPVTKPHQLAVTVGILLSACGSGQSQEANATSAANIATAPASQTAPAATATSTAAATQDVAVEARGLRLVDTQSGAARPLPFGMPKDELLNLLESFRGPADGGTNSECGAGPLDYAVWADGLTLWFQEDKFAGWALDERAGGAHATVTGIGPGSTRRELEAAHEVTVQESTLGLEFDAGGLFGILDGPSQDARITNMWAGVSCNFG